MQQIKCNDCGTTYDPSQLSCPNCGCPTSRNAPSSNNAPNLTTDTGYTHEHLIAKTAKALYWGLIIGGFIAGIIGAIAAGYYGGAGAFMAVFVILVLCAPFCILIARIIWAFFMLYANISINLHEINMKIK